MSWQGTDQLREQLLALADGELSAEDRAAALAYLASNPDAAAWLAEQAEFESAIRRQLTVRSTPAPQSLRIAVDRMSVPSRTKPLRMVHFNWLAAAAAIVIVSVLFVYNGRRTPTSPSEADVIPASVVSHASAIHSGCSRLAERLHADPFPSDRGELSADVEHDLHSDHPWPDLTSIGFHYTGAGPCGHPLSNAVHLLYHADDPHSPMTISVFVQPVTEQFTLEEGRVYTLSVAQSPFPMLAWRSKSVVYFLLADDAATEQAALAIARR